MTDIPVHNILSSDTKIREHVGDRIYSDVAPVGTKTPFIVWQVISGQALNDLDSPANFDSLQIQIMVYSNYGSTSNEVKNLCRKAVEHKAWILNPSLSSYDSDRKIFAKGFDANYILHR